MNWRIVMSKKLTPLETWYLVKEYLNEFHHRIVSKDIEVETIEGHPINIIETALKDYEKKTKLAKEYKDVNNVAKRLHAFTLLNDCDIDVWLIKHCDYENYCRVRTLCLKATGNADVDDANREVINLPTEKEFDFLKEMLK